MENTFKSGYIGIVGKPNVGKSTLLNHLVGQKISIISPKPQTTRNRIMGVVTTSTCQMVFLDTPGIHSPKDQLHQYMKHEIDETVQEVDLLLFLLDPSSPMDEDDQEALVYLNQYKGKCLVVVNKTDLNPEAEKKISHSAYAEYIKNHQVLYISALKGEGCDSLLKAIEKNLPAGPQFFPEDTLTDRTERFIIAEIIREKAYALFSQEVPYSIAVVTEEVKERTAELDYVKAVIYVEKESQKGILIGAQGKTLKKLGQSARGEIEELLDKKVYLELWVKVKKNWRRDPGAMKQLGMEIQP
jgi:GTP-binding protein Era